MHYRRMGIRSCFLSLTLLASALGACTPRDEHRAAGYSEPLPYVSNGERIYFTGVDATGYPIPTTGGRHGAGMHRQMHGGGCASCHGANREGRRLWPQFWVKAPALTPSALFGDDHGGDGHGDHSTYDADSLRRAITSGIDPSGRPLDEAMPRWRMRATDLDDLIAYLRQTHDHD